MSALNDQTYKLPGSLDALVKRALKDWDAASNTGRVWSKDATLWSGRDEHNWLGWLSIVDDQLRDTEHLRDAAGDVQASGFTHMLLLGMGGSSLCPEVLAETFGRAEGFPEAHVLDSTDPAQVTAFEQKLDLEKTLFVVASKSGSTLEPSIFKEYFYKRMQETVGLGQAGDHFAAITDPGSKLEQEAERDGFRAVYLGVPEIGGRFSALSNFGMVPAAFMGIDTEKFLRSARQMVKACQAGSAAKNPGAVLGVILGCLANEGRNKLTLIASPGIYDLGAWIEQLIAESTGKHGKAIIPVDREALRGPRAYGDDRVFVYLRLESKPNAKQDAAVEKLEAAGQPVIRIAVNDIYDLGQEFFRWEIATAVAGAVMGLDPFDQPDVQFSKTETKKLTDAYEEAGRFPHEWPFLEDAGVKLYTDPINAGAIQAVAGGDRTLAGMLRAHLGRIGYRDYCAILAYIEMNAAHEAILQEIRTAILDKKGVATCLGFGPRFLHSTGQAYKAGHNTGVFLQVTCDDPIYLGVPGRMYSFGAVKAAQARGDFQVLSDRARRALRVHLGRDVTAGLETLKKTVFEALA